MRDAARPAGRGQPGAAPPHEGRPGSEEPVRDGSASNGAASRPATRSDFEKSLAKARHESIAPPPTVPETEEIGALRAAGATIGERIVLEFGAYVDTDFAWLVTLEDDVVLAARAQVLAHDGATRQVLGHTLVAPVRICTGAYVGAGATILPGVTVGRYAVIGAGSIVSRDVPPETVVAGIPARAICSVHELVARQEAEVKAVKAAGLWGITTEECRDPEHRVELLARMRRVGRIYIR
jgi:acetyltransferase-like isoleucine patch superfamily enzyme